VVSLTPLKTTNKNFTCIKVHSLDLGDSGSFVVKWDTLEKTTNQSSACIKGLSLILKFRVQFPLQVS
jgi:hypothetical protein